MPRFIKDVYKIYNLIGIDDWVMLLFIAVMRFVSASIVVDLLIMFALYLLGIIEIKKIDKHKK